MENSISPFQEWAMLVSRSLRKKLYPEPVPLPRPHRPTIGGKIGFDMDSMFMIAKTVICFFIYCGRVSSRCCEFTRSSQNVRLQLHVRQLRRAYGGPKGRVTTAGHPK